MLERWASVMKAEALIYEYEDKYLGGSLILFSFSK